MAILYIGIGGALGAISRYLCSNWVVKIVGDFLPYGTMAVNILGSFFLGMIYIISTNCTSVGGNIKAFLTVGFIGSFTTFSTFTTETVNLLREGKLMLAGVYLGGSVLSGLISVLLGMTVANFFLTFCKKAQDDEYEEHLT